GPGEPATPVMGAKGYALAAKSVPAVLPEDAPDPIGVQVLIYEYDTRVRRSDPHGMTIRFEASSAAPIVRLQVGLDDGAPPVVVDFPTPRPPDGRYLRAVAFKPVRNGTWTLTVRAVDEANRTGVATGSVPVVVEP
ncbi:MAG TPA: hypothetical protein VFN38_07610, partial [Gemmatimonadaceae bacterium]|nr:hypothetical protein [Gemmatimonadaceae bacterium]